MSAAARKQAPPEPAPKDSAKARPRWKVTVTLPDPMRADATNDTANDIGDALDHIPLECLREAASPRIRRHDLPFRPQLEAMFGRDLPAITVLTGPEVEAALDHHGAEAASRDGMLYLRRDPSLPIVAHELTHILQVPRPQADPRPAEAEAEQIEARAAAGGPLPQPGAALAPGSFAFRMQASLSTPPRPAPRAADAPAPAPAAATTDSPAEPQAQAQAQQTSQQHPADSAPAAQGAEPPTADDLAPVAAPDLTARTEGAEAQAQSAMQALDAAQDANAVMAAFVAAPPSVKAREAAGLDARMAAASARARAAEAAQIAPLEARMSPGDALPAPAPVPAPDARIDALETTPPPPASVPQLAPTPDPGRARANADLAPALQRDFIVGDPQSLDRTLDQVQVRDAAPSPDAGARPAVPLEGASDPARLHGQQNAAATQTTERQAQAAQAVIDGPGPEQIQLRETAQSVALPAPAEPQPLTAQAPVAGAAAFAEQGLDATTVALFDAAHGPDMQASLAGAQAQMDHARDERDSARQAELDRAGREQARLNGEADTAQRDVVTARRNEVQQARRAALDEQAGQVAALHDEAAGARDTARTEVDGELDQTQSRIDADYSRAEAEAAHEIAQGQTRAEAERDRADQQAANDSWWDRAVDWVKAQLDRLTAAINAIFDAVRAAVRAIIDAVKAAALALITAAATLIKGIIEAYGALLHLLVDRLLAEHFPRIAAALNGAIDAAVNAATQAVDRIAALLRRGIEALMTALAAALDALLAAWQGALNAVLALANAALQGDWRALARLILTPILMALGIPPDAFFQLFDRAAQSIDLISADPAGFLENLLDAVKGGIRRFADHFRHHLMAGIILWLTGPLGRGIVMPAQFDLWGLLDVARQALGLTLDTVRRVAVRVLGEGAVQKIEYVLTYVRALITGGWQGLWEQLTNDLGMLRDMVLDQLRTFLLEKVVVASIMWLASLFNPIGALVKLVMTIWNFIQFLRTQLSRIFAVVQTVINTMWEIATGVLEPPIRGVEQVLGRLVPVVLDLLARLLGVGGIPEKVQEILRGVRLRIETALERLMRRVLAAFGVRTRPAEAADNADDLMQPLTFAGGGESHTLYVHETASGVVPMMRSTPTPVATWLQGLRGAGLDRIGNEKRPRWDADMVKAKRAEIEPLNAQAIGQEASVDQKGEQANQAEDQALQAEGGQAPPPSPALLMEGKALAEVLSKILVKLGLSGTLEQVFATQIEAMWPDIRANFKTYVLARLDPAKYAALTWDGLGGALTGEAVLTEPWRQPATATGLLRRGSQKAAFMAAVKARAIEIATGLQRPDPAAFFANDTDMERLFANYLTEAINQGGHNAALTARLLGPQSAGAAPWVDAIEPALATAVERFTEAQRDPDFDIKDKIKPATFVALFEDAASAQSTQYNYYLRQNPDGSPIPPAEGTHPLVWFLRPGGASSPRNGPNREHVSNAIRRADAGMHEWIPASLAHAAISATAAGFATAGNLDAASGVANFIEFQHRVRTPTRNLIFKPGSFPKVAAAQEPYISRAHHMADRPFDDLTQAEIAAYYPAGGPQFGDKVTVLQAHAGGLRGRSTDLGWSDLQSASPQWHIDLQQRISTSIGGQVQMRDMATLRTEILGFFRATIWRDSPDLASAFDLYQVSGTSAATPYRDIKRFAGRTYDSSYGYLRQTMDEVINS